MNIRIHIEKTRKGYQTKVYKNNTRKLIGTCDLLKYQKDHFYLLTGLGVKRKNMGLGSILVKISQEIAKKKRKGIMLRVVPSKFENKERLERFYRRLGFRNVVRSFTLDEKEWMVW